MELAKFNATTKKNLKLFVENPDNHGELKFPAGFGWDEFESLSVAVQESIYERLWVWMGYRKNMSNVGYMFGRQSISKKEFDRIGDFKFSNTIYNKLVKIVIQKQAAIKKAVRANEPAPEWNDIDVKTRNNFKKWLGGRTKDYDAKFSVKLFDELPNTIKVEFLLTLAKKFGVDNYYDLKSFHRTANEMQMGVKSLKISEEIQDAIYDVIPVTGSDLLQIIKKSDTDGTWSGKSNSEIAKGLTQEQIDAARAGRKADAKMAKLKARVKSMMSLEAYKVTLADPLFDRDMFETILKRMENQTAFKDTWSDGDSKDIIKLIVTHPLATTKDLLRINKMKTRRWGGASTPLYNSSHINSALANKDDLPINELMKLIKLQQYDLKVSAVKRKDLSDADKNVIIEYTIKHHSHMPDQLKEIFEAAGKTDLLDTSLVRGSIIAELKKKYSKGTGWQGKPNGLKFLEVMDNYGWFHAMTPKDYQDIAQIIIEAYKSNRLSKQRIIDYIDKMKNDAGEFLVIIYEETGEEEFMPKELRELFIF